MNSSRWGLWPFLFSAVLLISSHDALAEERIRIVTTIPTLKDFARRIGGEKADVTSLLRGGEDLHTFDPRPSDIRAVSMAKVVVKIGIGLDDWIDRVIKASGNKRLLVVTASEGIGVIASKGEHPSHAHGNPHVWHDVENAKLMAENIYQALINAAPQGAGDFKENRDAYMAELLLLSKELDAVMSGITDRRVVTYHPGWAYLLRRFRLKEIFTIETSPGREPSARDIARAIDTIGREKVKVILGEPEAPGKVIGIISRETGARVVNLAPEVGSLPKAGSYIEMMRYNVGEIAKGLK